MSKVTVGTTPAVQLITDHRNASGGGVLIQNLGTGNLYIDSDSAVAVGTGFKLASGATVVLPKMPGVLYAIADAASTDVRYVLL